MRNYTLVNELRYFYEADNGAFAELLDAMSQWVKDNPEMEVVSATARLGFDSEAESPYLEGEIEFCDSTKPLQFNPLAFQAVA